jgi:hypothetical protein
MIREHFIDPHMDVSNSNYKFTMPVFYVNATVNKFPISVGGTCSRWRQGPKENSITGHTIFSSPPRHWRRLLKRIDDQSIACIKIKRLVTPIPWHHRVDEYAARKEAKRKIIINLSRQN